MPWLRLDDAFDTHPKLLELTELERWRWTRLLLHCARHRTEGVVTTRTLREVGLTRSVRKLVSAHLLDPGEDEASYIVHDFGHYNPKDPLKAERMARWRERKAQGLVDAAVDGPVDAAVDAQPSTQASTERLTHRLPISAPSRTPVDVNGEHEEDLHFDTAASRQAVAKDAARLPAEIAEEVRTEYERLERTRAGGAG